MRLITILLFILYNTFCFSQNNPNPVDYDGDGILNTADNCIFKNNPAQADEDNDGIGDVCNCNPSVSNPGNNQKIPGIVIWASPSTSINSGTMVTFSSDFVPNGGNYSYQWKKNGNDAGTNSASFSDDTINQGDIIPVYFPVIHLVLQAILQQAITCFSIFLRLATLKLPAKKSLFTRTQQRIKSISETFKI